VVNALKLIGGKWKIAIIYNLQGGAGQIRGAEKRTSIAHYPANVD
jgi:DNA-binding HxlR family transcriptional regulator